MARVVPDNHDSQYAQLIFDPARVKVGQRWLYSAGANVPPWGGAPERLTEEIPDLAALAEAGAEVIVLNHQGSAKDGTAGDQEHIASAWQRMGLPVRYDSDPWRNIRSVGAGPGTITLLRNTRLDPGEERCDEALARAYATLAPRAIIGGFSKSHRRNASNTGILQHMPTWLSRGLAREVAALEPLRHGSLGALVLGGMKREKAMAVTGALADRTACVLLAGGVLNSLRRARGLELGNSSRPTLSAGDSTRFLKATRSLGDRLVLPTEVCQRESATGRLQWIPVTAPTKPGWAVVDVRWDTRDMQRVAHALLVAPRAVVAGPPGHIGEGHAEAAGEVGRLLEPLGEKAVFLGGDTCTELDVTGTASAGGGAALVYLSKGFSPVVEDLRRVRDRRRESL
ncbi:phosphoglycerate kinase [Kocuria sp.]|uniref:phosphoglycerate kinase n=1 Tax=Kocuria sp. TaxID=1871328 RepID=UPI0034CE28DE